MKVFVLFVSLLIGCASAQAESKKLLIFAVFLQNTPVQLADGAKWMMDKGDAFPVIMYKDQGTKVVLQLAGTSFPTEMVHVKIAKDNEVTDAMLASYRRNVVSYLDGRAKKWVDAATATPEPVTPTGTPLFEPVTPPQFDPVVPPK